MIRIILALAAFAAPVFTSAATHGTTPPSTDLSPIEVRVLAKFDHDIADMMASYAKTQECFETEKALQKGLAEKKAQLAREFGGNIPLPFSDLLWKKKLRIDRQHQACVKSYAQLSMVFNDLDLAFGGYEPKTLNVSKQRARVDAQKIKFRQMMPPAQRSKTPKNDTQE